MQIVTGRGRDTYNMSWNESNKIASSKFALCDKLLDETKDDNLREHLFAGNRMLRANSLCVIEALKARRI